ncbi:MAG: triose-phosphate isomerase [Pseudomonadota bacterium]
MRRKLAAGNWKMNGLRQALTEVEAIHAALPEPDCDVLICPPATLIRSMVRTCEPMHIEVGGQDCHENPAGAHTGDISAAMLADTGASYVILGHSERRAAYLESDAQVRAKTRAAWDAGLTAIICIGETLDERDASNTLDIVGGQMAASVPDGATGANTVLAYEPIWAIGTGRTATTDQIEEVHSFVRASLCRRFGDHGQAMRILYGGSMNPTNAGEIAAVADVDGGLVGGASLHAEDFIRIIDALGA